MALNTGKLLRINLSSGKVATETVPESIAEAFVGGRGYGIRYLYQELSPGTDPLGEENKLLILNGPLAGNMAQATSRRTRCPLSRGS